MSARRIDLIKRLDRIFGPLLVRILWRPRQGSVQQPIGRVLVIRPGGIGDAVLLAPAVLALQSHYPGITIDFLAECRNAGVFPLVSPVRRIWCYDRCGDWPALLANRYDAVIDTEQWHRLSAVVTRLIRSTVRIGFATNERSRLFTHGIGYSHTDYEAESFLHLLEPLGITAGELPVGPWLQVPTAAFQVAAQLLGPADARPLVALFPGATIAERRWGMERFRDVAQWCAGRGARVIVVGGGEERSVGEQIAAGLDAVNLAGRTSLAETAAVLARAAVLVSGDSGILHLAVGLGRPTVSLFGAGIAAKWAPRGSRHLVLNRHLPCSPCTSFGYTPPCPINTRCLREISVADVTAALGTLLEQSAEMGNP